MILLIIDVQKLITNEKLYRYQEFLTNLKTLIKVARDSGTEVIYLRHNDGPEAELSPGKAGYDIADVIVPDKCEMIFDKEVNSPFKDSGLLAYLQMKKEKTLIVAGLQTEYCIDATVKCGFEHGFDIIVPSGCNTTVDNSFLNGEATYTYYHEFIWKDRYARCISLEETVKIIRENKV